MTTDSGEGRPFLFRIARACLAGGDPSSTALLAMWGIPLAMAAAAFWVCCVPPFHVERRFTVSGGSLGSLEDREWRTLYSDPRPEAPWPECERDPVCPGNPRNGSLFRGGGRRDERHTAAVRALRGRRYWVGRVIPREVLAGWRVKGATVLSLGHVYGTTEVFVDGRRVGARDGLASRLPLTVDLPDRPRRDMSLAVRILNDMDDPFPDVLAPSALDAAGLEKALRRDELETLVKPALVLGYNAALAVLFALMWVVAWRRQEFAGFAAYCLVNAAKASLLIPFVWLHAGNHLYQRLYLLLACYSVLAVLFLALTFARLRTWYTASAMVVSAAASALLLLAPWSTDQFFERAELVYRLLETPAYFLGAVLVLLQARLVSEKRGELVDPYREAKLYLVAAVLAAIPFVYRVVDLGLVDVRSACMSLMMLMVVQEYGRQSRALSRSPQSKYHQLAVPVVDLPCGVVSLDVKNSERLFDLGAERGAGGGIVKGLIQDLLRVADDAGAVLLSSEGDSLILMLPERLDDDGALRRAVGLCISLHFALKRFLAGSRLPADIEMRVALESGRIRPVWNELGGRQVPGWEQVGSSTVFVDLARMLEAEAKLRPRSATNLVVKPGLAEKIRGLGLGLSFAAASATIKHGRRLDLEFAVLDAQTRAAFDPDGRFTSPL